MKKCEKIIEIFSRQGSKDENWSAKDRKILKNPGPSLARAIFLISADYIWLARFGMTIPRMYFKVKVKFDLVIFVLYEKLFSRILNEE